MIASFSKLWASLVIRHLLQISQYDIGKPTIAELLVSSAGL
jgi:hypothetical protein